MTSVARRSELDDSCDYSDASHDNENNNSGNDGQVESDYGDARGSESDSSEREEGDGVPESDRPVDHDEDRSNPQYIPKRGTFYEHDDRTAASGEETTINSTSDSVSEKKDASSETPTERRRPPRKSEIIDKWSHDKFNEKDQMPKSRDELVAIYGYDIRNEVAPPHARRNRRYGRGPNKYTRTWEDVEAYKRQANATPPTRKPPTIDDFPELDTSGRRIRFVASFYRKKGTGRPRSKSQPPSNESSERSSSLRRNASIKTPRNQTPKAPFRNSVRANNIKPSPVGNKAPFSKDKLPQIENLTITAAVNSNGGPQRKVNASGLSQQRPVPSTQPKKPATPPQVSNNTSTNKSPPSQHAPAQKSGPNATGQQNSHNQTGNHESGLQAALNVAESRGIKRYSSLRQRALGDNFTPPQQLQQSQPLQQQAQPLQQQIQPLQQQMQPQQQMQQAQLQQHSYVNEYQTAGSQQLAAVTAAQHQSANNSQMMPPTQMMHQQVHRNQAVNQSQHGPSPPLQSISQQQQQQHNQQVRLGMMEQQQLVSHAHHQMHNMQQPHTMVSNQMQQPQGYVPPSMIPAQYMQSGNSGVFAGPMYAQPPPAPYPHQLYQHHNYVTAAAQAGGVTYYAPGVGGVGAAGGAGGDMEGGGGRAARRPRPTAAIPILKPNHDKAPNSADIEKIDRVVDNMFVRKPWPINPDPKEKSETKNSQEPASKETSQPNSMTSSSISSDSRPSIERTEPKTDSEPQTEDQQPPPNPEIPPQTPQTNEETSDESTRTPEVIQSPEVEASIANA